MELLSLRGDLTRDHAVERVLTPSTSTDADSELCLHLAEVQRLDVVTAAAVRLRLSRHEREHPQGTVNLVLPSEPGAAARLAALLDPLPSRIKLAGQVDGDPPANYALVPATVVDDSHSAVALGGWTLDACERAEISEQRSAFIAAAAMELADNAVVHAEDPTDSPVAAATSRHTGNVVEIAVLDTGRGIAESDAPRDFLRTIPRRALDGEPGFLGQILQRARRRRSKCMCRYSPAPRGCCGPRRSTAPRRLGSCPARRSSCASPRSVRPAVRPAWIGTRSRVGMVQRCQ